MARRVVQLLHLRDLPVEEAGYRSPVFRRVVFSLEPPDGRQVRVDLELLRKLVSQGLGDLESSPEMFVLEEDGSPSSRDAGEEEGGFGGEGVAVVVNVGRDLDENFGVEEVDEVDVGVGLVETDLNVVNGGVEGVGDEDLDGRGRKSGENLEESGSVLREGVGRGEKVRSTDFEAFPRKGSGRGFSEDSSSS